MGVSPMSPGRTKERVASPRGLEPLTCCLGGSRSILLSYGEFAPNHTRPHRKLEVKTGRCRPDRHQRELFNSSPCPLNPPRRTPDDPIFAIGIDDDGIPSYIVNRRFTKRMSDDHSVSPQAEVFRR